MSAVASASTFEFDATIHRLNAIQKAAYRYTGHFHEVDPIWWTIFRSS